MISLINLVDYFLNAGFFHPVIIAFGVFGLSCLVQFVVFGGFDDI